MANKRKYSPEEHEKSMIITDIRDIKEKIEQGLITKPPRHRKFKVGERVQWGAHKETYIREIYEDGMYYLTETIGVVRERNNAPRNEKHIHAWMDIYPYTDKGTTFRKEEKYRIRQFNSGISSLLHMIYRQGIDFDVEYQREHVWKLADKVALIDSIFNNIDIGKFVLVQRDYTADVFYEILDGKQRLTAIKEFYEDRFKYKGFYYSDLSTSDKNKFEDHSITYGYLENPSKEAIFETFIKLNTCGKPMDKKHINHVKQLLNEL